MANAKKKDTKEKDTKKKVSSSKKNTDNVKKANTKSNANTKKKVEEKKVETKKVEPKEEIKETNKEEIEKNHDAVIRNIIIAVLVVVLLIVLFVLNNNSSKKYTKSTSSSGNTSSQTTSGVAEEASKISDDEKGDLTNVTIDEYLNLLKGDSYSIIYIGRPTCAHCQNEEPIMRYMVYKYDLKINYLNTDELDSDGQKKLQDSNEYFESGWGTPLILVVKDNKIVDKFEGETSIEDLTTMFKKYELIK